MEKVYYIHPPNKGSSVVKWTAGSFLYEFDCGMKFSDAKAFMDREVVVVFHSIPSDKSGLVGKAFNFEGKPLYDIPFPTHTAAYSHLVFTYMWSSENPDGVKMVFGYEAAGHRDFWCDFDLDKREYTASGEAR